MQKPIIQFELSPYLIIVCLAVGLLYAFVLYQKKGPWSKPTNYILAGLRLVLVFLASVLLLGPILKQTDNTTESPTVVFAIDNSMSVAEVADSVEINGMEQAISQMAAQLSDNGYQTEFRTLGEGQGTSNPQETSYNSQSTNLSGMLRKIQNDFEGRNLAEVVLVSDGIINAGMSPVHSAFNFNIHTLGIGDTVPKADILIKNLLYNKISYQGNKFPLVVETVNKGLIGKKTRLEILQGGKLIESKPLTISRDNQLARTEFYIDAKNKGLQRYEVRIVPLEGEFTTVNNRKQAYVEVVEGKEKILAIAPAPHPDIKAIRSAIASNANYEFTLYIPGIHPKPASSEQFDLVIFHQAPDKRGLTAKVFSEYISKKTPYWVVTGGQSDLNRLAKETNVMRINNLGGQRDNVNAVFNQNFSNFSLTTELQGLLNQLPPVAVPFAQPRLLGGSQALLFQQVGSIVTDKPLLAINGESTPKGAVMVGEGLWRWKLHEFAINDANTGFNELVTKLVQFLSSKEDKRKFKVYPLNREYDAAEPVVFDSEVYNDLYERVYGNKIDLTVTDEEGTAKQYSFVTNNNNTQYKISGLSQGVYRYSASTEMGGKTERVSGEFVIKALQIELVNLTADFGLLRKVAGNTGNKFYPVAQANGLAETLTQKQAKGILHASERFLPLVNLKWLFFLLLGLVSIEWLLRKYHGSY